MLGDYLTIRLRARDFYVDEMIVDEVEARIEYTEENVQTYQI